MSGASGEMRLGVSGPRVGEVRLDSTQLRGEGGWADPRLVLPLTLVMQQQPIHHQIALTRLTASLHTAQPPAPSTQLGGAATLTLLENMPCLSVSAGPNEQHPEVRIPITQPLVARLEALRHAAPEGRLSLYLHLEGTFVWLRHTGNSGAQGAAESTLGEGGWDTSVGLFSEMLPFWNSFIAPLRIEIEPRVWVEQVLPGVGYDQVRLVELNLANIPALGILPSQFDEARRKYDAGDYPGCVATCRSIQTAWEQHVGATRKTPLATTLAEHLHWPPKDWHTAMLDAMWKGYADMVNAPHHPEQEPPPLPPTAADARFCLLFTAIISEYLDRLRNESQPNV